MSAAIAGGIRTTTMTLLEELETGVDPGEALCDVYFALMDRGYRFQSESQRHFFWAWESFYFLQNYTFIKLIEQATPLEEYSECLVAVGFPKAKAVFDQLISLLPADLRQADDTSGLIQFARSNPAPMEQLLLAYFEAVQNIDENFCRYLLDHRDDFAYYLAMRSSR